MDPFPRHLTALFLAALILSLGIGSAVRSVAAPVDTSTTRSTSEAPETFDERVGEFDTITASGAASAGDEAPPVDRSPTDATLAADPDPAVVAEMARGRYWHASRLLTEDDGAGVFLRARAQAGWGNWAFVWRLLETVGGVPPEQRAEAWAMRGRAAEEIGRPTEAEASYRRALEEADALGAEAALVLRIRLARLLAEDESFASSLDLLREVRDEAQWAADWLALEVGEPASDRGEVEAVRSAVATITDEAARLRAWDQMARAHLSAGDSTAALAAYLVEAREATDDDVRSRAWSRIGVLRLARGEQDLARIAFRNSLSEDADLEAARGLFSLGLDDPEEAYRVHRILRRGGDDDDEDALSALDTYAELRGVDEPLSEDVRLDRARLLVATDRLDAAVDLLRDLSEAEDLDVAASALDLWSSVRRRQGRTTDARTLQDRLAERFPSHSSVVDDVFFRGDDRHDRQDWSGALADYGRVVELAPEGRRSGVARMRMGQIHLTLGHPDEAARVFEEYLESTPGGRHWDEARYWAAFSLHTAGEEERAREHVRRIHDTDPLSYYAVLGGALLDEPFSPELPEGTPPPGVPEIEEAVDRLVVLKSSGLAAAVPHEVEELIERYEASGDSLLRLSLELSEHGFSMDGIGVAWEVQSRGRGWDRWLVRAVYPFPYRELVRLEAEEWGVDPFYLAALIRQESAFLAEARSGAGAVGLMQVMPATGREVARTVGPEDFSDTHLLHPEVNLHIGAAFLSRLTERFGDRMPLVLSAYNAGPTRASGWARDLPEAEDPLRFTERIPYEETRGYVKQVTRNVELYRWLYGAEE